MHPSLKVALSACKVGSWEWSYGLLLHWVDVSDNSPNPHNLHSQQDPNCEALFRMKLARGFYEFRWPVDLFSYMCDSNTSQLVMRGRWANQLCWVGKQPFFSHIHNLRENNIKETSRDKNTTNLSNNYEKMVAYCARHSLLPFVRLLPSTIYITDNDHEKTKGAQYAITKKTIKLCTSNWNMDTH